MEMRGGEEVSRRRRVSGRVVEEVGVKEEQDGWEMVNGRMC